MRTRTLAGFALLLMLSLSPAQEARETTVGMGYIEALEAMRTLNARADVDHATFAEKTLPHLPPACFKARLNVLQWLLAHDRMTLALRRAGTEENPALVTRDPTRVSPPLETLLQYDKLAQRALAVAKAQEYEGRYDESAAIRLDVIRLSQQLANTDRLPCAIVAAGIMQRAVLDMEGFYSRSVPVGAVERLSAKLKKIETPIFSLGDCLRNESLLFTAWLTDYPHLIEKRLATLSGGRPPEAVRRLAGASDDEKLKQVLRWIDDYRSEVKKLARSADRAYRSNYEDLAKREQALRSETNAENPLPNLLLPPVALNYDRLTLAEAHFGMIRTMGLLIEFGRAKDEWPDQLDRLRRIRSGPAPRDPFSGKDFEYRTPGLAPAAPDWMRGDKGLTLGVDLEKRAEKDQRRLGAFLRGY